MLHWNVNQGKYPTLKVKSSNLHQITALSLSTITWVLLWCRPCSSRRHVTSRQGNTRTLGYRNAMWHVQLHSLSLPERFWGKGEWVGDPRWLRRGPMSSISSLLISQSLLSFHNVRVKYDTIISSVRLFVITVVWNTLLFGSVLYDKESTVVAMVDFDISGCNGKLQYYDSC